MLINTPWNVWEVCRVFLIFKPMFPALSTLLSWHRSNLLKTRWNLKLHKCWSGSPVLVVYKGVAFFLKQKLSAFLLFAQAGKLKVPPRKWKRSKADFAVQLLQPSQSIHRHSQPTRTCASTPECSILTPSLKPTEPGFVKQFLSPGFTSLPPCLGFGGCNSFISTGIKKNNTVVGISPSPPPQKTYTICLKICCSYWKGNF